MKKSTFYRKLLNLAVVTLVSAQSVYAQNVARFRFTDFNRGRMSDAFRGAQLRVTIEMDLVDLKGFIRDTVVLGTTEKVFLSRSQQSSTESRVLTIDSDQIFQALRSASDSITSAKIYFRYVEVDLLRNDPLGRYLLVTKSIDSKSADTLDTSSDDLVNQVVAALKSESGVQFQDWEEIKTHTYQVDVDDYVTEVGMGLHWQYNFSSGEFEWIYGPTVEKRKVGSHKETRSYQTGGGTKASFKAQSV